MKRSIFASIVISGAIIVLLLCYGSQVAADAGVANVSAQFSSPAAKLTSTFTPSHWIYLPFVGANSPLPIRAPEGQYLLVEYWTHRVMGASCMALCVDFPTYNFDPQSGVLFYAPVHLDPAMVLGDDDVGYMGSGESIGGLGCGAGSDLTKIASYPSSQDGITLRYADELGTVTLERQGQTTVLEPGETWAGEEQVQVWDWMDPACVVTSTQRLTNYAFQDRDKIVYSP